MKCKNCPLYENTYSRGEDWEEYDVQCVAGSYFGYGGIDCENGGCRRTDKWILTQDKEELKNRLAEEECESMFVHEIYKEENAKRAETQGWILNQDFGNWNFTKGDKYVPYYEIDQHILNPITVKEALKKYKNKNKE